MPQQIYSKDIERDLLVYLTMSVGGTKFTTGTVVVLEERQKGKLEENKVKLITVNNFLSEKCLKLISCSMTDLILMGFSGAKSVCTLL